MTGVLAFCMKLITFSSSPYNFTFNMIWPELKKEILLESPPPEDSLLWEESCPGKRIPRRLQRQLLSGKWPHWFHNFGGGVQIEDIKRQVAEAIETPRCRGGWRDEGGTRDSVRRTLKM